MHWVMFLAIFVVPSLGYSQSVEDAYQHVWEANQGNPQRPPQSPEWFATLANRSADEYDAAMINQLAAAMNVWVADPGTEEQIVCEDIIDRISQRPSGVGGMTASACFAAAEAAEIVGSPDKTMAFLREALNVCGTQPAPGAEQVTVNVVANMWLGRLSNNAGLADDAVAAYQQAAEAVDPSQPGLQDIRAWCMLYAGEIQAAKGDKEAALETLGQVDAIMASSVRTGLTHVQSEWAKRLVEEIGNGSSKVVTPAKPYLPAGMAAELQGKLNGSSLKPMNGIFHDADRNGLFVSAVENGIPRNQSTINRELGQVRLGELYVKAQRWAEAESVYRKLYEGGGFLAPFAGMRLAECLAKLDRAGDAAAVLKNLIERWPAYTIAVQAECNGKFAQTKDAVWQSVVPAGGPPPGPTATAAAPASPPSPVKASSDPIRVGPPQPRPGSETPTAPGPQADSSTRYYIGAVLIGGIVGVVVAGLLLKRRKSFRANQQEG